MTDVSEIFDQIPFDQLAAQLGVSEAEAQEGAALALPALVSGLKANAEDPGGAASLFGALQEKDTSLVDGSIDLSAIDTTDGAKIVQHIFGDASDEVPARLGGAGALGGDLMKQLLPILAPIVLGFLAKQFFGDKGGSSTTADAGGLPDILGSILGGATGGGAGGALGGILGSVLGGMAGGGATTSSSSSGDVLGGLGDILGGLLGGGTK